MAENLKNLSQESIRFKKAASSFESSLDILCF